MKSLVTFQFRFPWEEICDLELVKGLHLDHGGRFPGVILEAGSERCEALIQDQSLIGDRSLIRLIRKEISLEAEDFSGNTHDCGQIVQGASTDVIGVHGEPSDQYEIQLDCAECGRFTWKQVGDLKLKRGLRTPAGITENEELLVSRDVYRFFLEREIDVEFRPTNHECTWQILPNALAEIDVDDPAFSMLDPCTVCTKPRRVLHLLNNGIDLLHGPFHVPRIEEAPPLKLLSLPADFCSTNVDFGTVGAIPEGAKTRGQYFPAFQGARPYWVATGSTCRQLLELGIGVEVWPAKIEAPKPQR